MVGDFAGVLVGDFISVYVGLLAMCYFYCCCFHQLTPDTVILLLFCSRIPRKIYTILRVKAVKVCIGAKFALAVSKNVFFLDYLKQLNPGNCPPYQLEGIRILECMIDYAKQELGSIMDERQQELFKNLMSGTIDFCTDLHCKQQFGCFVVDLTAEKYKMKNGNELFMSMRTKNQMDSGLFTNTTPIFDSLEYPMNFEVFVSAYYGSFPFCLIEHCLVLINDNFVLSLSTGLFKDHC